MIDFDYGLLGELAEEAPTAGFTNVNYGKLETEAVVVSWKSTDEINPETGKNKREKQTRPLKKGEAVAQGEYLEVTFRVLISEFNPSLEFEYERKVNMKKSGNRVLTDWSEIVEPSLIATFGNDWAKKISKNPYVAVEDADNVNGTTSQKSGKVLTVPKFIAVYKNRTECERAREARFNKSGNENGTVPADVLGQVKGLLKAVTNHEQLVAMLSETEPFSNYDAEKLIELASA